MRISRRKPSWPSAGVHTRSELDRKARRLNRHNVGVKRVLGEMRRGATLQLSYAPRPHWRLSTGAFVTDEMARTAINLPNVIGVGDCLIADGLSQTFRYVTDGDNNG
jgi:hypothetical protein